MPPDRFKRLLNDLEEMQAEVKSMQHAYAQITTDWQFCQARVVVLETALRTIFVEWDTAPWHRSDGGPQAPYCLDPTSWKRLNYKAFSEGVRSAVGEAK